MKKIVSFLILNVIKMKTSRDVSGDRQYILLFFLVIGKTSEIVLCAGRKRNLCGTRVVCVYVCVRALYYARGASECVCSVGVCRTYGIGWKKERKHICMYRKTHTYTGVGTPRSALSRRLLSGRLFLFLFSSLYSRRSIHTRRRPF